MLKLRSTLTTLAAAGIAALAASGVSSSDSRSSWIESNTATAPASRSSAAEKPPVRTVTDSMPARFAASTSQVVSPTMTASSVPAFSIAARTRSGSGLVASTSAEVVQSSASSRASSRSR